MRETRLLLLRMFQPALCHRLLPNHVVIRRQPLLGKLKLLPLLLLMLPLLMLPMLFLPLLVVVLLDGLLGMQTLLLLTLLMVVLLDGLLGMQNLMLQCLIMMFLSSVAPVSNVTLRLGP
jgi:hypothetical protein